jgi:hypothetical protein
LASRDTVAARSTAEVAALRLTAAGAVEEAAIETEEAARAAVEAASHAKVAASRARSIAGHATSAAWSVSSAAKVDKRRADKAVTEAERTEANARDRVRRSEKASSEEPV